MSNRHEVMEIVNACLKYSFLGLNSSERWLTELFESLDNPGMEYENKGGSTMFNSQRPASFETNGDILRGLTLKQRLKLMRAKSYMDSKEYSRAFGLLNDDVEMNNIAIALFMKNYSLFLSLEKQNTNMDKFENMVVNPSDYAVISVSYSKIEKDISSFLNKQRFLFEKTNDCEFVGLLEWLLSAVIYRQNRFSEALDLQIKSVYNEPFNWSCWLDMVKNITRCNSNGITGNCTSVENGDGCVSFGLSGADTFKNNDVREECVPSQEDVIIRSADHMINENQRSGIGSNIGLQPFKRKHHSDAFKQFRDSSYKDYISSLGLPDCILAHLSYGLYLGVIGRWRDALNEYMSTTKLYFQKDMCPSYIESQMGKCSYELGDAQGSLTLFQKVSNRDKYYLGNAVEMANILSESNNIKELSLLAKKCVEISKYSLETCLVLGMYHWLTNDKHKALKFYKRALLFDNKSSFTWTLCGHALHELGNTRGSLFAYRTASNLDLTNVTALYGIAQIYSKMNLHSYSIKIYEKAIIRSPTDSFLWYNMGTNLEKLGNYQEASRCYYKALSFEVSKGKVLNGTDIKYMGRLLKIELEQWNQSGALYWAKKIIQRAIEYGYLEKICDLKDLSFHDRDCTDADFASCDQNLMRNDPMTDRENVFVSCDKQQDLHNLISYQEESGDSFFLEWDRLRWSVRTLPQKLPVEIISAIESIMQIQSSIPREEFNSDDNSISRYEIVIENLRELLNVPRPLHVIK